MSNYNLPETPQVIIDSSGVTIPTLDDYIDYLKEAFRSIYVDSDLTFDSNTPHGQIVHILSKALIDQSQNIINVYNQGRVTFASGSSLDDLTMLNGVFRKEGTYTKTNIQVTFDLTDVPTVFLVGLDAETDVTDTVFTVSDDNDNSYFLLNSVTLTDMLVNPVTLLFRAENLGVVSSDIGTIVNIDTNVEGVISVVNLLEPKKIGSDGELDEDLRLRRALLPSIQGASSVVNLYQYLLKNEDVKGQPHIIENTGQGTDIHGVPKNSLWIVLRLTDIGMPPLDNYSETVKEIAKNVLKKVGTCGSYHVDGDPAYINTVLIEQMRGLNHTVRFQQVEYEYFKFTVNLYVEDNNVNVDESELKEAVKAQLTQDSSFDKKIVVSDLTTIVQNLLLTTQNISSQQIVVQSVNGLSLKNDSDDLVLLTPVLPRLLVVESSADISINLI